MAADSNSHQINKVTIKDQFTIYDIQYGICTIYDMDTMKDSKCVETFNRAPLQNCPSLPSP
jgi:hypothetical protein